MIILKIFVFFAAWVCFVTAMINIIAAGYQFAKREKVSWGLKSFLRSLFDAACLSLWCYLLFILFPSL